MLLPLVFISFIFFPWHFGKTVIFQIIVEVLVFFLVIQKVSLRAKRSNLVHSNDNNGIASVVSLTRNDRFLDLADLNFLDWSILTFLAIITLTSLIGANPSNSFWGNQARANGVFVWIHFGAFYFLLISFFRSHNAFAGLDAKVKAKSHSFFLTAVIVAVLASFTALFSNLLPESWRSISGGGLIGNRAFLASYLILAVGVSLYLFVKYENKWRWSFLMVAVLFFYTVIDTGNRGALLGIVMGIFFGLTLYLFFIRNKKIKIWSAISLIIFCSLLLIFFIFKDRPILQKNIPSISSLANISLSSGTARTRILAWQSAWQGIKERPFQGWGWGNYGVVFDKYYNPLFLKYGFSETVWDKPHNWLLEIGVTSGVFGIIGYLAILFFAGYYLLRGKNFILFATIVAYFIADLFLFETTNGLILWFLLLAFISSQSPPIVIGKATENKNNYFGASKVVLFIIFIFSFYRFNFIPLRSSYFMRRAELASNIDDWSVAVQKTLVMTAPFFSENAIFLAEQLTKFDKAGAISKDIKIENAALLIAKTLDDESKKYPDNLAFPVWAGQTYLVLGEKIDEKYYIKAEESFSRALVIAPQKQEVLFLSVRLYLLKRDFVKAIDFAQKAIDVVPDISTPHWFLGLANVASGNRAQGLRDIEKAIELGYGLTVDQKSYVLDLYALEKNYPKLIEEYTKMIETNPENINWLIKLATVYAESGDKKAALETTRQAVGLFPPLKIEAEKFIKQYKLLEK
ncbi:MAG: O-antigen ligase family protein [Candidatus Magasanikbacteria bacterium]|nr:O-antigen ligase family protein [Candidatus Magasanikbacteria bacterium]